MTIYKIDYTNIKEAKNLLNMQTSSLKELETTLDTVKSNEYLEHMRNKIPHAERHQKMRIDQIQTDIQELRKDIQNLENAIASYEKKRDNYVR